MPNPCANQFQQEQEEAMRLYELDRESAESTTEPCPLCNLLPAEETCQFCETTYCDECLEMHRCVDEQKRKGMLNARALREKASGK